MSPYFEDWHKDNPMAPFAMMRDVMNEARVNNYSGWTVDTVKQIWNPAWVKNKERTLSGVVMKQVSQY